MNAPAPPASRRSSPAAERNRAAILAELQRLLPPVGRALEIASGTGQHVAFLARHFPQWRWQPTDLDPANLASIEAWCGAGADGPALGNVAPPRALDVLADPWPVAGPFDLVLCANMLHIAPWDACAGLMRGTERVLATGGRLITYGPYLEDAVETAPSNLTFDADLRRRDPAWGLRRREDVEAQARAAGLQPRERVAMPANNLLLVFDRPVA